MPTVAQYTDPVVIDDLGGPQEFARRRHELAKQLKTGHLRLTIYCLVRARFDREGECE